MKQHIFDSFFSGKIKNQQQQQQENRSVQVLHTCGDTLTLVIPYL